MAEIHNEQLAKPTVKKHPFCIKPLCEVLEEELPPIKKLVGDLIYSEEQTIIFGGTGLGKSIFAMQIAHSISNGKDLNLGAGVSFENECNPITVIYYDFELSQRQIQRRLKSSINNANLYWANIERGEVLEVEPKKMFEQLKAGAEDVKAKCIIIDNISAISKDLEKGENAKAFMGELWKLARDEEYTIIILSHIPKIKDFEAISVNHIKGSSTIGQLSDNLIGIGKVNSENDSEVYIKQVKVRNTAKEFGSSNVIHTSIKNVGGVLIHEAIGFANEQELLNNFSINTAAASNREFFTAAYLYYGSSRKAQGYLNEFGIKAAHTTISHNVKMFKEADSKAYKVLEGYDKDRLFDWLNSKSPNQDEFLPRVKGHELDSEIPF